MSNKPIVRVQFDDEDSFWEVTKTASNMNLKMPEFLKRAAIKVHNDIVEEQNAALTAQQQEATSNEETKPAPSEPKAPSSKKKKTRSQAKNTGSEV